jgi:hypothetical protein
MEEKELTPDESFALIASIISEAKLKFEENGLIYVMWGILVSIAAFSQYYLLQNGYEEVNYYPYFLMPLGGIFSFFYYGRKKQTNKSNGHLAKVISTSWITIGLNVLILGFLFGASLGASLIPMILILIGIGITIAGIILQYRLLFLAGITMNIIGLAGFSVDYIQQPLLLGIANLLCVLLPGILLMRRHKNK